MINIKLIGKKGSNACKEIRKGCNIRNYTGKTKIMPDILINYGLNKDRLATFFKLYPSARKIPVMNRYVGYSKFNVVQRAGSQDVTVPKTKLSLGRKDDKKDWIEKRINSIGGKGICWSRRKGKILGKYYQQFIKDRIYEIRVHAFKWLPQEQWSVQKRYGSNDEIAWNYSNGGHFSTVHSPNSYEIFQRAWKVSDEILTMLGMSFGAIDFIVNSKYELYFIEINSAPGFTELSKKIYVNAFDKLKDCSLKKALKFTK
jgi:glutathione synthase/RimK-type ligase-like ATP-grasp enzyme